MIPYSERFPTVGKAFQVDLGRRILNYVPTARLDHDVARSQSNDPQIRWGVLTHVIRVVDTQNVYYPSSENIVYCASILNKLARIPRDDLMLITYLATDLLDPRYPFTARELAARALKDAAWHEGPHTRSVVSAVVGVHTDTTPDMRLSFIRALYASFRHSPDLVKTPTVRHFLEEACNDQNSFVANRARKELGRIFLV
ncbi:MAG: hypothetical protein M1426_03665 [Patescibacteria group bacterium]|nr:hypothetical protein [Patescibacteria group bacterium]